MAPGCGHYEVVVDAHGKVVAIGARLATLVGHAADSVGAPVGQPVAQLFRGPALAGPLGQTLPLELRGGERAPISGCGIRSADGDHFRITFMPELATPGAARASASESPLRAVVAEIHDALTAVSGFAALAQLAPTPHRRRYHADQICAQVERMRRLGQALDPGYYARNPLLAAADLAVELPRALSGLRIPLERHGVAFEVQCGDGALWASCDVRLLGDLVTQLIVRATLAQRPELQANEVDVTVLPSGPDRIGIALRFGAADEPHALLEDGFGLGDDRGGPSLPPGEVGLRWAHLALERQGGTYARRVDRAAGEVHVTLTLPRTESPRLLDQMRTPVPLDVLAIDDDAVLGELYVELLGISGHTVTPCRSFHAAREALRARPYDIIVAEFALRDGLLSELWAEAAETYPVIARRVLVVTRDPRDRRLTEWAARAGATIMAKPFLPPALIDRIALIASHP